MEGRRVETGSIRGPRWWEWTAITLTGLAPLVYLSVLIAKYGVDVPQNDQWDFLPVLRKFYAGSLTLRDLWAQHNEHRIFFPRLVMLALVRLTGWNVRWEMATSLVLAAITFFLISIWIIKMSRIYRSRALPWLIPALSILMFSLSQSQNWLWGWQLQELLNVAAVTAGILALSTTQFKWWRFALAVFFGVIATYSFANGLFLWFIGAAFIACLYRGGIRVKGLAVWLPVSVLVIFSYLHDYQDPSSSPPPFYPWEDFGVFARYVFKYLGNPLGLSWSYAAGLLGFLLLVGLTILLGKSRKITLPEIAPFIGLAAYSLCSACITAVGRAGFDTDQALSSRYILMAQFMWMALMAALLLTAMRGLAPYEISGKFGRAGIVTARCAAAILLVAITCQAARYSLSERITYREAGRVIGLSRDTLLSVSHDKYPKDWDSKISVIYADPNVPLQRWRFLADHHLSAFRDWKP